MPTAYVHIGSEKCGSSLIEFAFLNNHSFSEFLEKANIFTTKHFHLSLRQVIVGTKWDEAVHGRLRSQMLTPFRSAGRNVFISEELLLSLMHEPGKPNPFDLRIDFAKRLLQGFDKVKLILVVRRQDKFIESHYNQQVKRGETREFEEVVAELPLDNYCWDVIAETWDKAFGEGSMTVIPFETSVLETSTQPRRPNNALTAICQVMGVPIEFDTASLPVVNPSIRPDLLAAQREINATFDREIADRVADILARKATKAATATAGLFSPEARQQMLDRYADSNRRLFEKYIPQCSVDEYLNA